MLDQVAWLSTPKMKSAGYREVWEQHRGNRPVPPQINYLYEQVSHLIFCIVSCSFQDIKYSLHIEILITQTFHG